MKQHINLSGHVADIGLRVSTETQSSDTGSLNVGRTREPKRIQIDRPGPHPIRDDQGNRGFRVVDTTLSEFAIFRVPGLFEELNDCLAKRLAGKRVFVLADPGFQGFYGEKLRAYLDCHGIKYVELLLPYESCNERNKTLSVLEDLALQMQRYRPQAGDVLLIIGGGVVMDVGGFLASVYRRGLSYISVPTTLLAIVDASISPKTAVNVAGFKNLFGTKHPPALVLYDPQVLRSLKHMDFCNGITEVLKTAIVGDRALFDHLSETAVDVLKGEFCGERGSRLLEHAIELFLNLKWTGPFYGNKPASIRSFGHGFSRELETASHFSLTHGQAVAVEMAVATCLSFQTGILCSVECERILACFRHLGLPTHCQECVPNAIWNEVFAEKAASRIPFYYPIAEAIGKGRFLNYFTRDDLSAAMQAARHCHAN